MSLIKVRTNNSATNPFENLLNDFFEGEFTTQSRTASAGSIPAANVKETEKSYKVELASPGMNKEDFKIELDENLLTISSEKEMEKEDNGAKYTKQEFKYTSFKRSFRIPEEVDAENISAKYENGILTLIIPKKEIEEKKVRQIEIK